MHLASPSGSCSWLVPRPCLRPYLCVQAAEDKAAGVVPSDSESLLRAQVGAALMVLIF